MERSVEEVIGEVDRMAMANKCRMCAAIIPKGQVHCAYCRHLLKEARDRAPDREKNVCPDCKVPITLATARSPGRCPMCQAKKTRLRMKPLHEAPPMSVKRGR